MNFLRETGRSIQQDDNSYKFILIQKNNSTRTNLANSTSSTSNTSKHLNEDQQINLSKELPNLKIQQQQNQNNNLNGKFCFYFFKSPSLSKLKASKFG
jgi:hypothetical protein